MENEILKESDQMLIGIMTEMFMALSWSRKQKALRYLDQLSQEQKKADRRKDKA